MQYKWLLWFATLVAANVEKTIFVAPEETTMTTDGPSLSNLCLQTLTPVEDNRKIRISLPVSFPTKDNAFGKSSWYLLQHLKPGQRYEVRICWSATVRISSSLFIQFFASRDFARKPQTSFLIQLTCKPYPSNLQIFVLILS
jgi:hypothetical protein